MSLSKQILDELFSRISQPEIISDEEHAKNLKIMERLRIQAVKTAWAQERQLLMITGQGSRHWTPDEKKELISTGQIKRYSGVRINQPDLNNRVAVKQFIHGAWRP